MNGQQLKKPARFWRKSWSSENVQQTGMAMQLIIVWMPTKKSNCYPPSALHCTLKPIPSTLFLRQRVLLHNKKGPGCILPSLACENEKGRIWRRCCKKCNLWIRLSWCSISSVAWKAEYVGWKRGCVGFFLLLLSKKSLFLIVKL